jgi:PBP1b-binding outer membrane lipoprotein LpoB
MPHRTTPLLLAVIVVAASLFTGCRSQPGGRIDVGQTTEAERRSPLILPVALNEFSDQAPRRLVEDLGNIPRVRDTPGQVTVFLGDINNQTTAVSSSEFEMAMTRMRNRLINSNTAGERMQFVERRARMQRLAQRERVASGDFLADPEDYDPHTTYVLNGDFFRVSRGNTNQYYMQFQLVHFGSNQIVWSDDYEIRQVRGR